MLPPSFSTPGKPKYEPLPEGMYRAVVEDVNAIMRQKYKAPPGEMEPALEFKFLIAEGDYTGHRLFVKVSAIFTPATTGKQASNLFVIWRAVNKNIEPDVTLMQNGLSSDELNRMIGRQLNLIVGQKPPKDGNVYNEVKSYMASQNDLPKDKLPALKIKDPAAPELDDAPPVTDEDLAAAGM
jgi:hypothetical protein